MYVVDDQPVRMPHRHAVGTGPFDGRRDVVQRLVPEASRQSPAGGRDRIRGRSTRSGFSIISAVAWPADTEETVTIRVVLVAADRDHAVVLHLDQHAAVGGIAVHGAHRANGAAPGFGRGSSGAGVIGRSSWRPTVCKRHEPAVHGRRVSPSILVMGLCGPVALEILVRAEQCSANAGGRLTRRQRLLSSQRCSSSAGMRPRYC